MYCVPVISNIHTILIGMVLSGSFHQCDSAKILGVFPVPNYSHIRLHQNVMKALVSKGHHVTVISPSPLKNALENYTDIDISYFYKAWSEGTDLMEMEQIPEKGFVGKWLWMSEHFCRQLWLSPIMQNFDRVNGTSFDLIIYEWAICCGRLIHKTGGPPVVLFMPYQPYRFVMDIIGNYHNPGYIPSCLLPYSQHMSLTERINNIYNYVLLKCFYNQYLSMEARVMTEYYETESLPLYSGRHSFLLVHGHSGFFDPKPNFPNFIETRGILINRIRNELPQTIEKFVSEASSGVIYFSLGTNINSTIIPDNIIRPFSDTFSKLKQRVLWKWDSESVPAHSENVMVSQWLQQQDVLAHPNVHLFITQGGTLSLQESIYYEVPVLGIPFMAEQRYNLRKLEDVGMGLQIRIKDVTGDLLLEAINRIINDGRFKANAVLVARRFKDDPEDSTSLVKVVWWLEYALRHGTTPHLNSASLNLNALQLYLIDVVVFFIFTSAAFLWLCFRATHSLTYLFSKHMC